MDAIKIQLRPPAERGRLYPRYSAGILSVESRGFREWPHGLTIDGDLILDVDAEGVLANFDLHWKRSRWKAVEPFPDPPRRVRKANLAFTRETLAHKFFDLPLEVLAEPGKVRLLLTFAEAQDEAYGVELSPRCLALIAADRLLGFSISL